jgi:hypothetical protein
MAVQSHVPAAVEPGQQTFPVINNKRPEDLWLIPIGTSLQAVRRVLVLVPDKALDETKLLVKIRSNIPGNAAEMIFLGMTNGQPATLARYRRLGSLVAKARSYIVAYERLLPGGDWAEVVRKVSRPDDLIMVCIVDSRGVEQTLASLGLPVFAMTGLRPPLVRRLLGALARVVYEIVPFLIMGGFFWLQVQTANQTHGITTTILTILSVLVEIGLLYIWSLFLS